MNSNGTRFLLLSGAADFRSASRDCAWDPEQGAFMLARQDSPRLPRLDPARTRALGEAASPLVLDDHGQLGRLSHDRRRVEFTLTWPRPKWEPVLATLDEAEGPAASLESAVLDPVDAPEGTTYADMHLGGSGLLVLAWSDGGAENGLSTVDLRRRLQSRCSLPFRPLKAWVDGEDRIWVVGEDKLGLCRGKPLPRPWTARPDRFEPLQANPDPLRLLWQLDLPPHRGLIALAADGDALHVLAHHTSSGPGSPRMALFSRPLEMGGEGGFTTYLLPEGLPLATDLAALGKGRVVLLVPLEEGPERCERRDCPVLALEEDGEGRPVARLLPERWPRRSEAAVRFVRHRDNRVRFLAEDGILGLYRLAQARFPESGSATLTRLLDSGTPGTVWDRLAIEASIPPGCRLEIHAQAADERKLLPEAWERQPEPLLTPLESELPFARSRAQGQAGHAGLYDILLQRADGEVRELRGRYLGLRLHLAGDGRHSPAIFALRAWYPRFSWQASYLPEHFRQQKLPPGEPGPANGADLRERLLASFEGVLTPIEDRIAAAECLLAPEAVPAPWLPWLAGLLGCSLPAHWPEARSRRWIASLGRLQQLHGSYAGLVQALDILTDGAVGRGQVVPVEHFRLRRTLATVLGIDMEDAGHPLTLGTGQSGNSRVGDSLILSEDQARAFLALFAPEVAERKAEAEVVERFFDDQARRLTVLLHGEARALRTVVEAALPQWVPATVQWTVTATDHPFVLGLSPLLGIDTYLETSPPPGRVVLDKSRLGRGDLLHNPVALSPEHAVFPPGAASEGDWT